MRIVLGIFIITSSVLFFSELNVRAKEEYSKEQLRRIAERLRPLLDDMARRTTDNRARFSMERIPNTREFDLRMARDLRREEERQKRIKAAELEAELLIKKMNKRRMDAGFRSLSTSAERIIKKQITDRYLQN